MALDVVEIECGALGSCQVVRARGEEAMNALPRWDLEILADSAGVDLDAVAGAPARLRLNDELEGTARVVDLIVVEIAYDGAERRGHRYALTLSAAPWTLTLRAGHRIVLEKAAHEVVLEVLRAAGVPDGRTVLRLAGETSARAQVTQYAESDWAFIERLLAEEGISYWFDAKDGEGAVLVLGDGPGSHDGIAPPVAVRFDDASGMVRARSLSSLELTEELAPTAVTVRDFDVRNPDVYIEGSAGDGALRYFEYPAFAPDAAAAKVRAAVRLDQLRRFRARAVGASDCIRIQPGRLLRVEGAADDAMNREYLVVAVEHDASNPSPGDAAPRPYANRVTLVPTGEAPFRPAVPSRPRVHAVETAITTGPAGEEIHVDDLGAVKLRFFWDPAGITDDRSSAWARCLQWPLTGSMFLPRVGWEVPVMYLDGSPDRPFVLQRLYNATAVVPYPLPKAAATTSLKSATSPGGSGVNEIRMSDDAGAQEMMIHAARDQSVSVGGSATTDVGTDATHDVGLALFNVVQGSHAVSVGSWQDVNVGTDWATKVDGAAVSIIGALEAQSVSANRVVQAKGAYVEVVGAAYALQCNQSNMKVNGGFLQVSAAGSILRAGISASEIVAGARVERVGGPYSITASSGYSDVTYGLKRIQSNGAATEIAGSDVVTSAPIGKVTAASAALTSSGPVGISGTKVTIEAASLLAGALELSGGALQAKRGATKIKGQRVKIPSGAKVG